MSVLVTGAAGFIGSYLVPTLVTKGYKVFATDVIAEPQWISDMDSVEYMRADLSREAEVYKLMGVTKPEKVILAHFLTKKKVKKEKEKKVAKK